MTELRFDILGMKDDGFVRGSGASWPPSATQSFYDEFYNNDRITVEKSLPSDFALAVGLLRFLTAGIPDDATITSAVLKIWPNVVIANEARNLTADWYNWGQGVSLDDYTANEGTNAHAGTSLGSIAPFQDNDFALSNLQNINKEGYTYLRIHVSGGQPVYGGSTNKIEWMAFSSRYSYDYVRLYVDYSGGTEPDGTIYDNQPPIIRR